MSAGPEQLAARVAVIAALDFEAAAFRSLLGKSEATANDTRGLTLVRSGAGSWNAARAARTALADGADGLVSWGVAGGLDPAMCPGTVVIPATVRGPAGETFSTHGVWSQSLARIIGRELDVCRGDLLSSETALGTPRDKARAASETGAVAVDMESVVIGRIAAAAGRPFVAVRVILDGAADSLPGIEGLSGARGVGDLRLLLRIAGRPAQWPGVLVLAWRYRRARGALIRCASLAAADAFRYPVSRPVPG